MHRTAFASTGRDAWRTLRSAPTLTCAIIATLAIAAGVNLAMLGLVDRLLLSPPPHLADPADLARVTFAMESADGRRGTMTTTSFPAFEALSQQASAFTSVAAFTPRTIAATIRGDRVEIDSALVSGSYFETLGTIPRSGRLLGRDDDRTEAEPAIVVSYRLWKARLATGPEPARTIEIDGRPFAIVGVTKAGFTGHTTAPVDAWIPLAAGLGATPGWRFDEGRNLVTVIVRLAPGASREVAAEQATAAAARSGQRVVLAPLVTGWTAVSNDAQIALWLAAIAALVFVTGLANAGTLLLIGAARRSHDAAVRVALGASRARLFAQVALESAIVSATAMIAGLLLSWWIAEVVRRTLLPGLAPDEGPLDGRMLAVVAIAAFAACLAMTALVIARLPRSVEVAILRGHADDLRPPARRAQSTLLVIQTALAMVLVVGAGLFGRSLYNVRAQDFGFEPRDLLLAGLEPGPVSLPNQNEVFRSALDAVRALPGVETATVAQATPFAAHNIPPIAVPGLPEPPNVSGQLPFLSAATPEFFSVLGMTLVEGRLLNAADERGAPVAVVNEAMARGAWPGRRALGQCFRIGFGPDFDPSTADGPPVPPTSLPCRVVVGVVRDMRQRSVLPDGGEDHLMQYFVPFSQMPAPPMGDDDGQTISALLVRVHPGAANVEGAVRRALAAAAGPSAPIRVQRYEDLFARQMRPWQMGATLLTLFGSIALVMGAVGTYAAFAQMIVSRRREMAIRAALGARPVELARLVMGQVLRVAAIGVTAGVLIVLAGGPFVASLLFRTVPQDPAVLAATALLVSALALAAGLLPATSAARSNPQALLRD
ncbi:MAG TPA: ABC transporter permease [Vicinamibacterales bacterium]